MLPMDKMFLYIVANNHAYDLYFVAPNLPRCGCIDEDKE
jgi:hypothetical protein